MSSLADQNAPVSTVTAGEPARFHRLVRLQVVGGFLGNVTYEFSNGLNCLIGPRGSGKSTSLEFLRYVCDIPVPGGEGSHSQRRFDQLIASNLGDGRVELTVETADQITYTIVREAGEAPQVFDAQGTPVDLDLRSGALFMPAIYSQNDVESIADEPSFQLHLIDSFRSEDVSALNRRIAQGTEMLRRNAAELRQVAIAASHAQAEAQTKQQVVSRIELLAKQTGPAGDEVNLAHAAKAQRDREQRAVDEAERTLLHAVEQLRTDAAILEREAQSVYPANVGSQGIMQQHRQEFERTATAGVSEMRRVIMDLTRSLNTLRNLGNQLKLEHQAADASFRTLVDRVATSTKEMKERIELEKRRNHLEAKEREAGLAKQRLAELRSHRQKMLDQLSHLRDQRHRLRSEIAAAITRSLGGNIKVTVLQNGNKRAFRDLLINTFRSPGFQHNVVAEKLVKNTTPDDLMRTQKEGDMTFLCANGELTPSQAERVLRILKDLPDMMDFELVDLDDQPKIELFDGQWKEAGGLSTGQKCTVVLPILLLDSAKPLLIDQPEDNLDNSFVYSEIVKTIRAVKQTRQLIFVTHNPNIPVLGDAERVFVLRSSGKAATLSNVGTVDQCQADIVTLLEGGETAFKERRKRYRY